MTTPVPSVLSARFRIRSASSAEWADADPLLKKGEPAYDSTNNSIKIGDGVTRWKQLRYVGQNDSDIPSTGNIELDEAISAHVHSLEPHPVYDDGPSLLLLYQNAKI